MTDRETLDAPGLGVRTFAAELAVGRVNDREFRLGMGKQLLDVFDLLAELDSLAFPVGVEDSDLGVAGANAIAGVAGSVLDASTTGLATPKGDTESELPGDFVVPFKA